MITVDSLQIRLNEYLLSSMECELKVLFPVLFAQFVKIKRLQNINILDLLEVF